MGMWESYLVPEEISAKHAREVLDFLNQVQDAEDDRRGGRISEGAATSACAWLSASSIAAPS